MRSTSTLGIGGARPRPTRPATALPVTAVQHVRRWSRPDTDNLSPARPQYASELGAKFELGTVDEDPIVGHERKAEGDGGDRDPQVGGVVGGFVGRSAAVWTARQTRDMTEAGSGPTSRKRGGTPA